MRFSFPHRKIFSLLVAAGLLVAGAGTGSAGVQTFSDDFDRPELGTDWEPYRGDWRITSGYLGAEADSELRWGLIRYRPDQYDLYEPFRVEARLSPQSEVTSGYIGIAFNIHDENNYLALRFRQETSRVQFYRVQNGVEGAIFLEDWIPVYIQVGDFYDVMVEMTAPGEYTFTISNEYGTWTRSHASNLFLRGSVGVYGFMGDQMVESFSLQAHVPEPAPEGVLVDHFIRDQLGPDWNPLLGDWRLFGNVLGGIQADPPVRAMVEYVPEPYDLNQPFKVTARLSPVSDTNAGFVGIAFRIQDVDNFLALRFRIPNRRVQFYRMVNGSEGAIFTADNIDVPFQLGQFYDVTVEMSELNSFTFSISDGTNTWQRTATSTLMPGGTVGLYAPRINERLALQFTLEHTESLSSGYALWAEALPEGFRDPSDEPFADGIANLVRYAFGIAPEAGASRAALPQAVLDHEAGTIRFDFEIREDVAFVIEESENLLTWETLLPDQTLSAGEWVQVRLEFPVADEERRFLRVRLSIE